MRRVSGLVITIAMMMLLVPLTGCEEDAQEAGDTGLFLVFEDCLVFGVWVFIDGEYQDMASSEEPHFFPLPAGTYELYARSNATLGEICFCWTEAVTVNDGSTTYDTLTCVGAECTDCPE